MVAVRTGDISVSELSRALKLSGFNVTGLPDAGGEALSLAVAGLRGKLHVELPGGRKDRPSL